MPELPEVEIRRRHVAAYALNREIERVLVPDPSVLNGVSAASVRRTLVGRALTAAHRHGKWLFVRADSGPWLVLHFGMTGNVSCLKKGAVEPPYLRLALEFAGGGLLAFTDPRRFGEAGLTNDVTAFLAARKWGPDPTHPGFDQAAFRRALAGRRGVLKGILLNQQVIAGIGNLYADEMLFQAGLHPEARVSDLKPATIDRLYDAMMDVFHHSLAVETRYERLPDRFLLRHRNYTGQCPTCGRPLKTLKSGGRTAYYCPTHQRRRS